MMTANYVNSLTGFPKFYFAIGCSADTMSFKEGQGRTSVNVNDVLASGIRKLFKLGRCMNVHGDAVGRLSRADGSLASSTDR